MGEVREANGAGMGKKVKGRGSGLCHAGCKMSMLLRMSSRIKKE